MGFTPVKTDPPRNLERRKIAGGRPFSWSAGRGSLGQKPERVAHLTRSLRACLVERLAAQDSEHAFVESVVRKVRLIHTFLVRKLIDHFKGDDYRTLGHSSVHVAK